MALTLAELVAGKPGPVDISAKDVRRARLQADDTTVYVVLDDDPTGTQSVAGLPVLTHWEVEDFRWAFATGKPAIYVMTNSRSLSPSDAQRVNREVVAAATQAAGDDFPIAFISRSDSTLRGHFPLEPATISDELEQTGRRVDGIVIVPAFGDAGRITIDGIHYAGSAEEGYLPVGETQFAQDATFSYSASSLPDWVQEKTGGQVASHDVLLVDLATLRTNHEDVVAILRKAENRQPIIVDIVEETDLRLLALALIEAESAGSCFVYRVGPPFVRGRIGQAVPSPVALDEVRASRGEREVAAGGLIVVGSHVDLTTHQLDRLRERNHPVELELDVQKVIDPHQRDSHVVSIASDAVNQLRQGNVVVRTSRTLVTGVDGDQSLDISRRVSAAVVEVVQRILAELAPRFVIAKGGITSSDVATHGLGFRRAQVVGPMLPGIVSLWSGQDGPAAGIPYVVFAGNVGGVESLADVVDILSEA